MPILDRLRAENFRIIRELDLSFSREINVFDGLNGSGKTSVLEIIYLLGTGKSFRTSRAADYITTNEQRTVISGSVIENSEQSRTALGIEKFSSETVCRIDGQTVSAASALARHFSVVALDAQAFRILDDGPAIRRALIDRALFHVEHSFLDVLKKFHRALKQRNELLKSKQSLAHGEYWNEQLALCAGQLDQARKTCVGQLNLWLTQAPNMARWGQWGMISFEYRQGWRSDRALLELLNDNWQRDQELGTTPIGPHRAELKILLDGRPAANVVSRGQGKLLICALVAAQASFIERGCGSPPALLIDDLAAELDRESCSAALSLLLSGTGQAFVTTIEAEVIRSELPYRSTKWFHVKHGTVTPVQMSI